MLIFVTYFIDLIFYVLYMLTIKDGVSCLRVMNVVAILTQLSLLHFREQAEQKQTSLVEHINEIKVEKFRGKTYFLLIS